MMDEKMYRYLLNRMAELQRDIFYKAPKTMEDFNLRLGRFLELDELTTKMKRDATMYERE